MGVAVAHRPRADRRAHGVAGSAVDWRACQQAQLLRRIGQQPANLIDRAHQLGEFIYVQSEQADERVIPGLALQVEQTGDTGNAPLVNQAPGGAVKDEAAAIHERRRFLVNLGLVALEPQSIWAAGPYR